MSADNGVYILKTKDQYRVIHTQAIERVFSDYNKRLLNPMEVVLIWGNCKYTRSKEKAYEIAMERKNYTEYGIRTFEYKKTWKHIVEDAKKAAEIEKQSLKKSDDIHSYDNYRLQCCEWILNL
ncbi:MAG: hypothetical protein PHT02_00700 [Tissierellia bacterium]|nr:hypothetical protein [Tissierellia bacterium]